MIFITNLLDQLWTFWLWVWLFCCIWHSRSVALALLRFDFFALMALLYFVRNLFLSLLPHINFITMFFLLIKSTESTALTIHSDFRPKLSSASIALLWHSIYFYCLVATSFRITEHHCQIYCFIIFANLIDLIISSRLRPW